MSVLTAAEAVAGAVAAIANAAARDPEAQRIATQSRATRRARSGSRVWRRKVSEATERLAEADRADSTEDMVAAILDLHALGITTQDIADAHALAEDMAEG